MDFLYTSVGVGGHTLYVGDVGGDADVDRKEDKDEGEAKVLANEARKPCT